MLSLFSSWICNVSWFSEQGLSLLHEVSSAGAAQRRLQGPLLRWLSHKAGQLVLAHSDLESWPLSRGPLPVGLSTNCLGFLRAWWLDSKSQQPERPKQKLYCFFWPSLECHIPLFPLYLLRQPITMVTLDIEEETDSNLFFFFFFVFSFSFCYFFFFFSACGPSFT